MTKYHLTSLSRMNARLGLTSELQITITLISRVERSALEDPFLKIKEALSRSMVGIMNLEDIEVPCGLIQS